MPIELPKAARQQAIESIERYAREHFDEPIGNVAAGGLLGYFLEEIGPLVYNQAVADVQERLQMRIADLDIEIHQDEFGYWRKFDARKKR
ncbi:MAG: DUF2164 domain-containing protein [Burkholderiaceae bacterium]